MRLLRYASLTVVLIVATSRVASAHPGHAHVVVSAASPWHYWLQPEHALVTGVLLAIATAALLTSVRRWQAQRQAALLRPLAVSRHIAK